MNPTSDGLKRPPFSKFRRDRIRHNFRCYSSGLPPVDISGRTRTFFSGEYFHRTTTSLIYGLVHRHYIGGVKQCGTEMFRLQRRILFEHFLVRHPRASCFRTSSTVSLVPLNTGFPAMMSFLSSIKSCQLIFMTRSLLTMSVSGLGIRRRLQRNNILKLQMQTFISLKGRGKRSER